MQTVAGEIGQRKKEMRNPKMSNIRVRSGVLEKKPEIDFRVM